MGWGRTLNNLTGATDSAKQQLRNQMALQHDAQNYATWQMSNAHQMEVADLEKAGINPIISAGGSGASASVTEGSAQTGHAQGDILNALLGAITTAKGVEKTDAEINNIDAQTKNIDADTETKKQTIEWTPKLNQATIDLQKAQTAKAKQEKLESLAKTAAIQFNNKMAEMDIKKRTREYGKELDIYKQQMELKLMEMGVDKSTSGQAAKAVGKWVNALSPFTEFTGKSTSETPTYNINHNHNTYF